MLQFLLPNPTHHAIPLSLYCVQQIPAKVSNSSWFIHILPEFAFIIYFVNSSSLLSVSFLDYQTLEIIGWPFLSAPPSLYIILLLLFIFILTFVPLSFHCYCTPKISDNTSYQILYLGIPSCFWLQMNDISWCFSYFQLSLVDESVTGKAAPGESLDSVNSVEVSSFYLSAKTHVVPLLFINVIKQSLYWSSRSSICLRLKF